MPTPRIAVLMAAHNRREQTLAGLVALTQQAGTGEHFELDIYLVDAASSDGTAEAVKKGFPSVHIISASAEVYWGHGTRLAGLSAQASPSPHDFHLWLNDDVKLETDAVQRLLAAGHDFPHKTLVAGAFCDSSGRPTYGGFTSGRHALQLTLLPVSDRAQTCRTFNGNAVLIPRLAVESVGLIDSRFPHAMGDVDFGLRAHRAGFRLLQAPGALGLCEGNPAAKAHTTARARLSHIKAVKVLPIKPWWTLCVRHAPLYAPLLFPKPYVEALLPVRRAPARSRTSVGR